MPKLLLSLLFVTFSNLALAMASTSAVKPPNILLVVLDDLGYTDLGSYGSEIATPNLDKLAMGGTRYTNFYTAPTCSPTRAMLLTGADSHLVGLGNMHEELSPNQKGKPGYEGHLNTRAANLAEVLKRSGYNTYMTGKWHLGLKEEHSPKARGFEKSYALLQGGAGHFDDLGLFGGPAKYREDGKSVTLPEDFYSTRFFTEKMMNYIEADRAQDKPFFAYLAYTAVHWPIQAPKASIDKYRGRYDKGYDQLLTDRIHGAIAKGVLPEGSEPVPGAPESRPWSQLTAQERKVEARKMEIYSAMMDDVDIYMGKLVDYLKSIGEYDNTIIFFMSDNGAEGHDLDHGLTEVKPWVEECCNNSYDNMGKADSYLLVGANWARASAGAVKHYKGFTTEGGIKAPAFLAYPGLKAKSKVDSRFIQAIDVMPTLLELAGIPVPGPRFAGREVLPMTGQSFLSESSSQTIDAGWELMGKRGYRYGDWKLVHLPKPYGNGKWQLYNLAQDPGEQTDLAASNPSILSDMIGRWQAYADKNGVILPDWVSGY
ncbi:arylsulfatase [Pseudomaricurvus alkylphenolicus]|uniref:arylsulfatase n=1 Tax=Pseudomaricurvus alkylphenolicus TaxID=1306991 RepID=UPI00142252CE|nr:arylsulfatase [Pseudomaricurvus alkylphenolicus]NIB40779.1 arylsulfatase [Pseudomaricurvus alkylphenolicus]